MKKKKGTKLQKQKTQTSGTRNERGIIRAEDRVLVQRTEPLATASLKNQALNGVHRRQLATDIGLRNGNNYLQRILSGPVQRQDIPLELQNSIEPRNLSDAELTTRLKLVKQTLATFTESNYDYHLLSQESTRLQREKNRRFNSTSPESSALITTIPVEPISISLSPNISDPMWHAYLQAIYNEALDGDSMPGTVHSMAQFGTAIEASSKGFAIKVVQKNGKTYYHILGERGASSEITARRIAKTSLGRSGARSVQGLAKQIHWKTAVKSNVVTGVVLSVGGTTLEYALDPNKEFGSDFAVDTGFEATKSVVAGSTGVAIGALTTSLLASGVTGAALGSAVPVIGTAIGFIVSIGIAVAIEAATADLKNQVKNSL